MLGCLRMLIAVAALGASGCGLGPLADDPVRAEFSEACERNIAYRSMKPKPRKFLCECVYDTTLRALSPEERHVARFYLLQQMGVNAPPALTVEQIGFDAITKASKAIGDAVARCR
ncbi:MAG: hypothetical protein AAFO75_08890 [Pseudomonadota bacterium]